MSKKRLALKIEGIVQGVGFRPFIYNLAQGLNLTGYVQNQGQAVAIELEGSKDKLDKFVELLSKDKPIHSQIQYIQKNWLEPIDYSDFSFKDSLKNSTSCSFNVLRDLATCTKCLQEMWDPDNRRYLYPFINCTDCGPRFSIIESLPYDRVNTTMNSFAMCADCKAEYEDPHSRRFHAQPIACPDCGPEIALVDSQGHLKAKKDKALQLACEAIKSGLIVALKGLGGFQLLVDGYNQKAIARLRKLKNRPAKPFALLYPNLSALRLDVQVSPIEAELLQSAASPIVLLKCFIDKYTEVAPSTPYLGAMLPYTPLHHLLMNELDFPVVATSGNLPGEPICIDNEQALSRLANISDLFLLHNRNIKIPLDDSVVQVVADKPVLLRLGRGYAPVSLAIPKINKNILSYGAQERSAIAFGSNNVLALSAHIGDLDNLRSWQHCQDVSTHMSNLYSFKPEVIACDAHPDYNSTILATEMAKQLQVPLVQVQHHCAHVFSCLAEHQIELPVLAVAWDGTGYGLDGTIWGGEFIKIAPKLSWQRVAHLLPFPLVKGDSTDPSCSAAGLLHQAGLEEKIEQEFLKIMLNKNINTVKTSSVGRLFDGLAYLLGLVDRVSFSGQAALAVESLCNLANFSQFYPFTISPLGLIDWQAMIKDILKDIANNRSKHEIAQLFHNSLVEIILQVAQQQGITNVILTGGCFQNRYLIEKAINNLTCAGFQPFWNQQIPPNDGGIAAGQILACSYKYK